MIDWGSLAASSLWVLGCALALAIFSYGSWQTSQSGKSLSAQLKQPQIQAGFSLAGAMFCSGLLFTTDSRLIMLVWAVLGVFFFLQLVGIARANR